MSYDESEDVDFEFVCSNYDDSDRHDLSSVHAAQSFTPWDHGLDTYDGNPWPEPDGSLGAFEQQRIHKDALGGDSDISYSTTNRATDSQSFRTVVPQLASPSTNNAPQTSGFHGGSSHANTFDHSTSNIPGGVAHDGDCIISAAHHLTSSPWLAHDTLSYSFFDFDDRSGEVRGHDAAISLSKERTSLPSSTNAEAWGGPPTLECPHGCGQVYGGNHRRGNMQRHLRLRHTRHGNETEYCCEVEDCGRTFKRQDARLKHYRKRHPELRTSAAIRRKDYGSDTGAAHSSHRRHWPDPQLQIADATLTRKSASNALFGHRTVLPNIDQGRSGVPPQDQSTCDTEGDRAAGTKNNRLMCDTCGLSFRRLADLRRHAQKHEEPKFRCDVPSCERAFYRIDKLRDHVRQMHKGTVITTGRGSLRIEVDEEARKAVEKTSLYRCTKCDATFETEGQMNSHVNRKHIKRFTCPDCDTSFNLQADLYRHKASVHGATVDTSWRCTNPSCSTPDKVFVRKDNYLRHVRRCNQSLEKQVEDGAMMIEGAEVN